MLAQVAAVPEQPPAAPICSRRSAGPAAATTRSIPVGLRDAADAPWALIGRGDPALLERLEPEATVTVVGARRASSYGREVARELGRELAAAGLLVVSGLAFGIDACAHRGALDAGLTVAVLGCGADVAYPAAHRSLWRRICESGPGPLRAAARDRRLALDLSGPQPDHGGAGRDDRRGRGGAALGLADHRRPRRRPRPRPRRGAGPGQLARLRPGTNDLLAGGACLVRDAQDVLDAMLGPGVRTAERAGAGARAASCCAVLAASSGARETCDAVAAALDLAGAEAAAALATLEALGYVSCSLVGVYSRTLLAAAR